MASSSHMNPESLQIPAEPCPMPSIASDEEDSFVVLGNSMSVDVDLAMNEKFFSPLESNIIKDAENLIKMEISQISKSISLPSVNNGLSLNNSNINDEPSHEDVRKNLEEILEENERLKGIINQNNTSMKTMKEQLAKILQWQDEVQLVYQSHKNKFSEAKTYIDKLKMENAKLRMDVDKYKNIKEFLDEEILNMKDTRLIQNEKQQSSTSDNETVALTSSMRDLSLENEKLKDENEKIKLSMIKSSDFDKKMVEALEEKLQGSNAQIQKLNLDLMMEKSKTTDMEYTLNEEINSLKSQLDKMNGRNDNEEILNQTRQQLMNSQIKITELEQELKDTKIILDAEQNELQEIQKKLKENESERDDIFALKAQLDLYKADYDAEKNANAVLKENHDKIANDLQNLQIRNQQLLEEVELMRDRGFVLTSSSSSSYPSRTSSSAAHRVTTTNDYSCPKCNFGFHNYQSLENHVHRCLELDDVLP